MEHGNDTTFYHLLIVSLLAFLIPIITSWLSQTIKLHIPAIVGEIICGIIIGKSILGIIPSTDSITWLNFLALFGFTYLMFLSGLEINFDMIVSEKAASSIPIKSRFIDKPIYQATIYFVLSLILSIIFSYILYIFNYIQNWFLLSLILATVSVGIVVPTLKEKDLIKTYLGQTILICALLADFIGMILITIMFAIYTKGLGVSSIITVLLISVLVFIIHRLHVSKRFNRIISYLGYFQAFLNKITQATTQIKVRGSIALMIILIFLSQTLGLEVILGAFIAGILTTLILGKSKTSELEMKLDAIGYGFFIPIFFISVGIDLDFKSVSDPNGFMIFAIILTVIAFVVKVLPSIIFNYNFQTKNALSAGFLLASNLSLPIAAATIAYKAGLINDQTNTAIVMMAIISCIIAPIIFTKLHKETFIEEKSKIAIIGGNDIGIMTAKKLQKLNQNLVLIATNYIEFETIKHNEIFDCHIANNITDAILNLKTEHIKTLITVTDDDQYNLTLCIKAKKDYGIYNLISIVNNYDNIDDFQGQKINVINPKSSTAENIVNNIISPEGYAILNRKEEEVMIADLWFTANQYDRKNLQNIPFPGNALVVQISREEEHIVPHGNTVVYVNDRLTIVGNPKSVNDTIYLFGKPPDQYCPI